MPTIRIPLSSPVYKSVDGVELQDRSALLMDSYLDDVGGSIGTVKRNGLSQAVNVGGSNSVHGLYWWEDKQYAIAVSGGSVYKITYNSTTGVYASTALTSAVLQGNRAVSFATDGTYVFMANGSRIVYTDGLTATYLADADAPTAVDDVLYLDGYILANTGNNKFQWSDVNSSLSWSALSFASASGNSDIISGIRVVNREIYLFGPRTVEIWENDGSTPFARVPGGFIEVGCGAPRSIVLWDNVLHWLDDRGHFIRFDGRNTTQLSTPYDNEIAKFSSFNDCVGKRVEMNGKPFFVFSFPIADRTLAYNILNQSWSEFGNWVTGSMLYSRWMGNSYCYARGWNKHLVGDKATGVIYEMSPTNYTDNGSLIRGARTTGHLDFGTFDLKRCKKIQIKVKRGQASIYAPAKLLLRWKNDNANTWSQTHEISLGATGETQDVARIFRTGAFRTRQYEIVISDNVTGIYVDAEQEVDTLR